jgi:short-subunit dehydrogenase
MKPSAIIIGASSGIGLEICRHLAALGYRLGIAARRGALLDEVAAALPQVCHRCVMDVGKPDDALEQFKSLWEAVGSVDFVYLCAGTGHANPDLNWGLEEETIRVNALGFAALAASAMSHFLQ